jgi:pyridinium-3,5-bisthiocarboxylic acid mononucleotide nickel chelatase
MRVLYYDCFAGISGDMNLGVLIDMGVPSEYLIEELKKLTVDDYHISISKQLKMGINGTKVEVHINNQNSQIDHDHEHEHSHKHHKHDAKDHTHVHRNLKDIQRIIENSTLNNFVKEKSLLIFNEIAVAESKIHAKPIDEIHFHEVGAIDSIVDIVGAAICIDYLKPDIILASSVELGGGFVECAHGTFPVPAPATAEILKNIPVKMGKVDKETTTPTGAAILKVFVSEFTDTPQFLIQKTAYGIGHRDLSIPNVLRAYQGIISDANNKVSSIAEMIECNIDDMNPEHYSYLMDTLFEKGAQDVFIVPIIMKKSRPAAQLSILCDEINHEEIVNFLLYETTSLGLRYSQVNKLMLERSSKVVNTEYGPIRIKEGILAGKVIKQKAEFEDCIQAAKHANVTLKEVYNVVNRLLIG